MEGPYVTHSDVYHYHRERALEYGEHKWWQAAQMHATLALAAATAGSTSALAHVTSAYDEGTRARIAKREEVS